MRIIVFSDTHGNYPAAVRAVDEAGPVDLIVHLGDELQDAATIATVTGTQLLMVAGNCDRGEAAPRERCELLDGVWVFMTHGDRYQVKWGIEALTKKALAEKARVALFGHTHQAMVAEQAGLLLVNPGTLDCRRDDLSYALLTIDNGSVAARLCTLPPVA